MHSDAQEIGRYEPPPARDRLPTMPEDMSEYAWLNTGPKSWSDEASHAVDAGDLDEEMLASDDLIDDEDDDQPASAGVDELTAGLLADMWHGDVPRVVAAATGYGYHAHVPADRPASDYTVRLIPRHAGASVPLEAPQILWQR